MDSKGRLLIFSPLEQERAHMPLTADIEEARVLIDRVSAHQQVVAASIREWDRHQIDPRRGAATELFATKDLLRGLRAQLNFVIQPSPAEGFLKPLPIDPTEA